MDLEARHASEVLAQVQHEDPRFRLGPLLALNLGVRSDRRTGMCLDQWLNLSAGRDGVPLRVIETRRVPAVHRLSGVVGFAHQEVSLDDRTDRGLPGWSGRDDLAGPIVVRNVELYLDARLLAIVMSHLAVAD